MLHRILPLVLIAPLALVACDPGTPGAGGGGGAAEDRGAAVPCALGGVSAFKADCTVERVSAPEGVALLIQHPDGGFRRLQVATDGRGVVSADGSEPALVRVVAPGTIEVAIAGDRYRLPATVKGQDLPAR